MVSSVLSEEESKREEEEYNYESRSRAKHFFARVLHLKKRDFNLLKLTNRVFTTIADDTKAKNCLAHNSGDE